MQENWRKVKDYSYYEVSDMGNVRSLNRIVTDSTGSERPFIGRTLKPIKHSNGYTTVTLSKVGARDKRVYVHRLVAQTFIPNPKKKRTVNHKNGIKTDNCLVNLEWMSDGENSLFSYQVLGRKTGLEIAVNQIKDGVIVRVWESMRQAEREGGFDKAKISLCCKGRAKSHKGYQWAYAK